MNPRKLLSYTIKLSDVAWNNYVQGCGIDHECSTEFSSMCSKWDALQSNYGLSRYWVFRATLLVDNWKIEN